MFRFHWALALLLSAADGLAAPVCAELPAADARALTLSVALARVAACHPDVRAAMAALDGASADVQIAGQRPNPQLTVGAGSVPSPLGAGSLWSKTFDHSVRLDQVFERGNKLALRRAAAQSARVAALADVAEARRRASSAVAHAHQDLWAAQGRRIQLLAAVGLSTDSLRALDQRVRAGDAPALDAVRLRLDDARLQADLRQAEADGADLQRQLALLIGVSGPPGLLHAEPVDLAVSSVLESAPAGAVAGAAAGAVASGLDDAQAAALAERRPDVAAALARVRAAEQLRDLAAAARTRDVSVGLQFDHWPTTPANANGTGNTVSVSLTVPLFVHHANDGELARAVADLGAARELWARLREQAGSEIARAVGLVGATRDRRRLVAQQLEPAAEKVAAGAELAYRRGASSALELLDARRSLRAVRIERITADAELAKALADFQAAALPIDTPANPANP